MKFSWDESKDLKNFADHGIHLSTAAYIFNDPYRIERPDLSANNNTLENRWQTIGKVNNVLFVAYEERIDDEIHLISARAATARERRIYNGYSNDDVEPWGPAY
ncbi:MAG: BrnT family toxin [Lachnospiraceae bacterium]|nr:BrnT family toxin [Lachnospiraceae bacterium]